MSSQNRDVPPCVTGWGTARTGGPGAEGNEAWSNTARLTEAFRRAVLRLFVHLELFDADQAAGMLTWPHSGFHVYTAVWVPEDDRAFATRLARYCARNPVALERLTYDRATKAVAYRFDKSERPTAGTETVDPLEFLTTIEIPIPCLWRKHLRGLCTIAGARETQRR